MERLSARKATSGLTLIEVLVSLAVIMILAAILLPATRRPPVPSGGSCLSHLKQVDLGFLMYATDYEGKLPMHLRVANGAAAISALGNSPVPQYSILSTYIGRCDLLICPAERQRRPATNFSDLTETNLSYFLNTDVTLSNKPAASILAGDRNLRADGRPVPPGSFGLTTNRDMNWTRELHASGGFLAFADGHVEFCRKNDLNAVVQRQSIATNRLLVP